MSDTGGAPDLLALAAELAAGLEDVASEIQGSVASYHRGDVVFARVAADGLEIRLPEDIAEAAQRTPDAAALDGKPGWIRFTPRDRDRHVIDRATAWFQTAWRHASAR
jgi:hypothetical protein